MAKYICQNPDCQQPFTSTNRNPKYCSTPCKYRMMSTRTRMTCDNPECGKEIWVRPRDVKFKTHFCSEACQHYKTAEQRFWEKVDKSGGPEACWLWIGADNGKGYGHFTDDAGQQWLPHRYSYVRCHGPIPDGLFVCHHCDVRRCVNPAHLFLGTNTDNMQDASQKGRTRRGERHSSSKLTNEQVYEIRAFQGKVSGTDVADRYGVEAMTIYRIWWRHRWQHLPELEL